MIDRIALAVVIAVLAPLGDLFESAIKRNLDVKDFGTLVRGHGGVLDRFDGFLFVLPAVWYLLITLEPYTTARALAVRLVAEAWCCAADEVGWQTGR